MYFLIAKLMLYQGYFKTTHVSHRCYALDYRTIQCEKVVNFSYMYTLKAKLVQYDCHQSLKYMELFWFKIIYHNQFASYESQTWPTSVENPWWRHQMKTSSALLALCAGNSPVTGEFPSQRPGKQGFNIFFDLCRNKAFSKQSKRRWFETPSRSLWRHCDVLSIPVAETNDWPPYFSCIYFDDHLPVVVIWIPT